MSRPITAPRLGEAKDFPLRIRETVAFDLSGAISTDNLHFPVRVLVILAARGYSRSATLIEDTVLSIDSGTSRPSSSGIPSRRGGTVASPKSEQRSAHHGHAAASADGDGSHNVDP